MQPHEFLRSIHSNTKFISQSIRPTAIAQQEVDGLRFLTQLGVRWAFAFLPHLLTDDTEWVLLYRLCRVNRIVLAGRKRDFFVLLLVEVFLAAFAGKLRPLLRF